MTKAYYFGYWGKGSGGHYLYDEAGSRIYDNLKQRGLPWDYPHLDTGLLKNSKQPDRVDGLVRWALAKGDWWAFFWWDRSGDSRSNSCSCFVVQGFDIDSRAQAFEFASERYPHIIKRQKYPLRVLPGVWNKYLNHPASAVSIMRGTSYGNPFHLGVHGDRNYVCDKFEREVLPGLDVEALRGQDLLCCCKPHRCHGDSILHKANS